jgi:hypothetical protein
VATEIGNWVRREHKKGAKWHLVESIIDGEPVTRCGRRLLRVSLGGDPLTSTPTMPLTRMIGQPQLCKAGCDNGST